MKNASRKQARSQSQETKERTNSQDSPPSDVCLRNEWQEKAAHIHGFNSQIELYGCQLKLTTYKQR